MQGYAQKGLLGLGPEHIPPKSQLHASSAPHSLLNRHSKKSLHKKKIVDNNKVHAPQAWN